MRNLVFTAKLRKQKIKLSRVLIEAIESNMQPGRLCQLQYVDGEIQFQAKETKEPLF